MPFPIVAVAVAYTFFRMAVHAANGSASHFPRGPIIAGQVQDCQLSIAREEHSKKSISNHFDDSQVNQTMTALLLL